MGFTNDNIAQDQTLFQLLH